MNKIKLLLALLIAAAALPALAIDVCPDGKPADANTRAGNSKNCLIIQKYTAVEETNNGVILVFLHGDNQGQLLINTVRSGVRFAEASKTTTLLALRPGYRSELGQSDGFNAFADDDYTAGNVDVVAQALSNIKSIHAKKIILIGHSGGSAMTALIANRYPTVADAYIIVGCPCNIDEWRAWRNASAGRSGHWSRSLSPHRETKGIPVTTKIELVVGSNDMNTKPIFSANYVEQLQQQGVKATLTLAEGADHVSVLRSVELYKVINQTIAQLNSK